MTELLVRTSLDTGGGFRLDRERSSEIIPAEVAAEFDRLQLLYPQLPHVAGGPGSEIAVVTARYVPRIGRWIGILQGSGGVYGAAGTVQFATTGGPIRLVGFLRLLLRASEVDRFLSPGSVTVPGSGTIGSASLLIEPLADLQRLDSRQRVLLLDGERGAALKKLLGLAAFLPDGVARQYTWSSGLAVARIEREEYVVGTEWPTGLLERHGTLHQPLDALALSPSEASPQHLPKGLSWALGLAERGRLVSKVSAATGLDEWLDELETLRPLETAEISSLLRRGLTAPETERWRRDDLSRQVLESDPAKLKVLLTHPSAVVVEGTVPLLEDELVFPELVELEAARARRGALPLSPTTGVPRGFGKRLAEATVGRWDPDELLAARPWLEALGLNRQNAARLFPLSRQEIAERLAKDPAFADEAVAFARRQERPVEALLALSDGDPGSCGAVGIALVRESSRLITPFLDANRDAIAGSRGLHALLHGASEYLNRTGRRADGTPLRSDLVTELAALMQEARPRRLLLPWLDRHAVRLLTFASNPDYLDAMRVVARRRFRRLWASVLILSVVIIGRWLLPYR